MAERKQPRTKPSQTPVGKATDLRRAGMRLPQSHLEILQEEASLLNLRGKPRQAMECLRRVSSSSLRAMLESGNAHEALGEESLGGGVRRILIVDRARERSTRLWRNAKGAPLVLGAPLRGSLASGPSRPTTRCSGLASLAAELDIVSWRKQQSRPTLMARH